LLRRRTLTSQVVDYILNLIKTGKVAAGETLPTEKEFTATLGVSRTCVREGMKSLEFLRLIRIRPKIGAVVLEASPAALLTAEHLASDENISEPSVLIEFRKIIETGVASLAAEKATESEIIAMERGLEKYEREIGSGKVHFCTDLTFHAQVAVASKNPMAIMVWEMISAQLTSISEHTLRMPGVSEEALHDHIAVFRAIKEHNPAKARAAMRAHLEHADRVWRIIQAQKAAPEPAGKTAETSLVES
jgi:DNA-binding FadR family transcriptional regulator